MEDEEHEVYGQEIPVDGEDVDMGAGGDDAAKVRDAPVDAATRSAPLLLVAGALWCKAQAEDDGSGGPSFGATPGFGCGGDSRGCPGRVRHPA